MLIVIIMLQLMNVQNKNYKDIEMFFKRNGNRCTLQTVNKKKIGVLH